MIHHLQAATPTPEKSTDLGPAILLSGHRDFVNRFRRNLAVGALMLILALVAGVDNSRAADFYWTGGSDQWQGSTAWSGGPGFPASGDDAFFTNAATYTVTLNTNVLNIQSNFFSNAANTTAIVTLNLNGNELNPAYAGTSPGAFVVGANTNSTTIVYLASSTSAGMGLVVPGRIIVGRFGSGTMFVTNGNVSVATTILANGGDGCGTLVLSGPTVVWNNTAGLSVGNSSNSFGSTLVISNSAEMTIGGTFRVGSGANDGGCSNNTLLLDTGAQLNTQVGPVTIGNNGPTASVSPSYNNSALVQGGAVWNCGNSSFYIGWVAGGGPATGNVLTVGVGGIVTNVSHLYITATNTLNMAGGVVSPTADCYGTLQGFGTVGNNATIENGAMLSPFNSLGALVFSKKLVLSGASTTTVQLGTNSNATVVQGGLTLNGTLNVTDGGGFGDGTYPLFTYTGTLTSPSLTIGTIPPGGYTCTPDYSTAGVVNLIVTGGPDMPPVAVFTGTPTSGAVPLTVTFTDRSTGTITNRSWDFGDDTTTNTTEAGTLTHTYNNVGNYDVSLTVSGPAGTTNLTQASYIIAGNAPPVITSAATVTNAALQVGNVFVVVADDTNVFSVGATNTEGNALSYQWSFGDGVTNDWSPSNTVDHAYTTNCGPYAASVTISNGLAMTTSNFTIIVACPLDLAKLTPKVNFAKTDSDSCAITGAFDPLANTNFAGMQVTLDIGGGSLTFTLPAKKGTAVTDFSTFSTPTYNKKTGLWSLKASFNKGFWQADWANYGMTNATVLKPGSLVSDLPVILLLDNDAFMATTNLHYTAKQGKSGAAK